MSECLASNLEPDQKKNKASTESVPPENKSEPVQDNSKNLQIVPLQQHDLNHDWLEVEDITDQNLLSVLNEIQQRNAHLVPSTSNNTFNVSMS